MVEKKEEKNTDVVPQAAVATVLPATQAPARQIDEKKLAEAIDKAEPEQKMSRGEKWYNRLVYQGLNYWLNLGMSLYITDIFAHGGGRMDPSRGWLNKKFEATVNWSVNGLASTKLFSRRAARR